MPIKFLMLLLIIILPSFNIYAQSVRNNKDVQKILPGFREQYNSSLLTRKNPKSIFQRDNNIFPKTQTSTTTNPIFKGENFRVNDVFKQNKIIGATPEAVKGKGTNNQFKYKSERYSNQEIPEELKKLFKKK